MQAGVSAYVTQGVENARVASVIETAIAQFNQHQSVVDELKRTKQTLEERKTLDRAKGILMKRRGCSEDEAFGLLRQAAMNHKKRLGQVAEEIVQAAALLDAEAGPRERSRSMTGLQDGTTGKDGAADRLRAAVGLRAAGRGVREGVLRERGPEGDALPRAVVGGIRDKTAFGVYDASQMLYPMPLAIDAGRGRPGGGDGQRVVLEPGRQRDHGGRRRSTPRWPRPATTRADRRQRGGGDRER